MAMIAKLRFKLGAYPIFSVFTLGVLLNVIKNLSCHIMVGYFFNSKAWAAVNFFYPVPEWWKTR